MPTEVLRGVRKVGGLASPHPQPRPHLTVSLIFGILMEIRHSLATEVRGLKPTAPQRKPAAGSRLGSMESRLSDGESQEPAAGFRGGAVGVSPRTAVARNARLSSES